MFPQHIPNRCVTYLMPKVLQGTGNPVISPASVRPGESQNECFDFRRYRRSSRRLPVAGTIELPRHQVSMPSENGGGLDDCRDGLKRLSSELLAYCGEFTPLFVF